MKKTETSQMSMRAYSKALKRLLDKTTMPVAKEVCHHLWCDYIMNGIYPHPVYVQADIACAEGHLVNPPKDLPPEGVELRPGSKALLRSYGPKKDVALAQTEKLLEKVLTREELLQHKSNCLTLFRLFDKYTTEFKGHA